MKKIIYITTIIFLLGIGKTIAQDTLKLSLKQAIELGLNNRNDLKSVYVNANIAKNNIDKAKKELLPDISVNSEIKYYDKLQPTYVPAGILNNKEAEKLSLGMKSNTFVSLDLNYSIYKPGLSQNIKIAKNDLLLSQEKSRAKQLDIKTEISMAYYNVLLKQIQFDITREIQMRYKFYNDLAKAKLDNGTLLESDALQVDLDYKNAVSNTNKNEQNYSLAVQNLKYKMNVLPTVIILCTDSLIGSDDIPTTGFDYENIIIKRSEIKQLEVKVSNNYLELTKARLNYLPTVSLFANYSQVFAGSQFTYGNNFYWSPVDYIGIKFSIPITGNFKNGSNVRDSKLKIKQMEYDLKQKKADITYEIQQATSKLNNAQKNLTIAQDNYLLSRKICEQKKNQYTVGSFSYEKLIEIENTLNDTENNYISAVYDFLVAKIEYQQSLGE